MWLRIGRIILKCTFKKQGGDVEWIYVAQDTGKWQARIERTNFGLHRMQRIS
jgi:hypothetical protein